MTNELEKQFFDTFEIKPKWKSEQCDGWMRTTAVAYFTNLEEAKKFGLVFQEEPEYPQISDSIYLMLLATLTCISSIEFPFSDIQKLKKDILKEVIKHQYGFDKHQVRTLFEEG